ncbi:site-specific integrase [Flagellimonas sp. 389]|uniref:site-specific integrase n=1 Tax=Flagellimonas sp. 389 TaxID=2835862 RepID=UPI001BD3494D|nr:site-specific integrase [Flagellimonas sp. 389]MBS9464032.1 site-specific integrase [Flagellimonas sp. 389]
MRTSLSLTLDTRRERKDSSFPIIIRVGHFQRTTSISTGQSVPKMYWDNSKKQVRKSYKGAISVSFLNNLLKAELARAQEIVNRLHYNGELDFLSIKQLREKIIKQSKYESFFEFGTSKVKDLRTAQRFGTARNYEGVLNILKVFLKGRDLKFNEINHDFLKRFENYHLSKPNNTQNGLASYMRTIKAIYNRGIKDGIVDRESYPFYNYQIKTTPTEKRAIKLEYIKRILELDLNEEHELFHYRNYFLLSYMTMGMSFIDIAFLKKSNIIDERIKFQRKKTSKRYDIKITAQMMSILKYYIEGKKSTEFILPILKRDSLELQYKDAQWALKRYNKGLKAIAQLCGIEERLTSYVSRHSFATHAMLKNIPLPAISSMLGHSKLSTTQVYLKSLPNEILDAYHEELVIN